MFSGMDDQQLYHRFISKIIDALTCGQGGWACGFCKMANTLGYFLIIVWVVIYFGVPTKGQVCITSVSTA